jgi:hypothetical protein
MFHFLFFSCLVHEERSITINNNNNNNNNHTPGMSYTMVVCRKEKRERIQVCG